MRAIDADKLIEKLQSHHDFFVNAWGGFGNLPRSDKARVDEISHCISEVVNAPTITADRPRGEWIPCTFSGLPLTELGRREGLKWHGYKCSNCDHIHKGNALIDCDFCPRCGADMRKENSDEVDTMQ